MIINGSINHSYCGRKRKTHRKVKKVERTFRPLVRKEVYRRETEYYPSQEMMGIASKTDDTYKKEVKRIKDGVLITIIHFSTCIQ